MADMAPAITAKSDQLNSDDLMGAPITIRIRDTKVVGSGEQPVSIYYDGDNNKPWKPCKSMARVLVAAWGDDSKKYIGKYITLFRDPEVTWAGLKVGGIRISNMSDIPGEMVMPLTVTRGSKKAYTVKPITNAPDPLKDLRAGGKLKAGKGSAALKEWWVALGAARQQQLGEAFLNEMKAIAAQADTAQSANNDLQPSSTHGTTE